MSRAPQIQPPLADRRAFLGGCGAAALVGWQVTQPAQAQAQGGFVEGRHFTRLAQPQPVSAPSGKVEVLEFFSYACPHCYAFEPSLNAWVKKLPPDVVFRRVPVPFLVNAENFQRAYYALEALGGAEAAHQRIFDAVHRERKLPSKPEAVADLVAQAGVDREKFLAAFNSFGVTSKMGQARSLTDRYKINGVPSLGIQGRFVTSPSQAGGEAVPETEGQARALALAEQLIERVRKGG